MAGLTLAVALAGPAQAQEGWQQVHGSVDLGGSFGAVAASAADDIWVFGDDDAQNTGAPWIHHWDGQGWAEHEVPDGLTAAPDTADAVEDGQVWVAGSSYEEGASAAHYDGESWTATAIDPDLVPTAVAAVGTDKAWLLAGPLGFDPRAAYFDGTEWTDQPAPTVTRGLDAAEAGEVFAVGGHGDRPVVERWDGVGWTAEELPEVEVPGGEPGAFFNDVLVRSAEDVWAAGAITWTDNDERNHRRPLLAHYDGTEWTVETGEDEGAYESVADDGHGGLYLIDGHWNPTMEHRTAHGQSTRQQLTAEDHDVNVDTVDGVPGGAGAVAVGTVLDKGDPDEFTAHARVYGLGEWY